MIRVALLLILIGSILGAAPGIGLAKGQPHGVATVTLCIDGVAQAVAIDADGQPIKGGQHDCPECVATAAASVPTAVAPLCPDRPVVAIAVPVEPSQPAKRLVIFSHARAPPSV